MSSAYMPQIMCLHCVQQQAEACMLGNTRCPCTLTQDQDQCTLWWLLVINRTQHCNCTPHACIKENESVNAYHDSQSPDVSAAASGGALFGNSGANLLIAYGTVMSSNTAMTGGAVHCDSCQQLTMTTGSRLESNHAAEGGGACCITCECVLFQDVHFLNNRCVTGLVQSLLACNQLHCKYICAPVVSGHMLVHLCV